MNYAGEREIQIRKKRKAKIIVLAVVAVLVVVLTVLSCYIPMGEWQYLVNLPKISKRAEGELRIHFLDVGQGDATVIELPDGKTALIDGGDDTDPHKTVLLRYLNALKIETIDYLIATHADADHCGGLDAVLKYKNVLKAYVPDNQLSTGVQYQEFYSALEKKECKKFTISRTKITSDEPYTLSVLSPYEILEEEALVDDNTRSGVVWLSYQGVSMLFMGDAPAEVETALVKEAKNGLLQDFAPKLSKTQIIKISHHGSHSATTENFLRYIQAETAVISCGKDNVYGHPAKETLDVLQAREVTAYRTDKQGHIMITVSETGQGYTINTSK